MTTKGYALISVSDKTGIEEAASAVSGAGYNILSSGGTFKTLRAAGIAAEEVSDYTGFPEMMQGRVKTLHPKIHGGLLARRGDSAHMQAAAAHDIGMIDIVIVNLYPFEETAARTDDPAEIIENIDIGGPSMIRSAAKNHESVTVITDSADYPALAAMLKEHGETNTAFRKKMAAKAFARTAAYDSAISEWAREYAGGGEGPAGPFPERYLLQGSRKGEALRYGENPHQAAAFYVTDAGSGVGAGVQLHGKALSYNNIADADAALRLVSEFAAPAAAVIKHANPCGVAVGASAEEAYRKAYACDPVSAFGGIVAFNREADAAVAARLSECFYEVILAPSFTKEAREILQRKKNIRLLEVPHTGVCAAAAPAVHSVIGGFLLQEADNAVIAKEGCNTVTKRAPDEEEWHDLLFAFTAVKHVRSNAILLAKNGASAGIGAGQMSRVDAAEIAVKKAIDDKGVNRAEGAVVASDAFFPFADGLELLAKAGVRAVIQPGGSKRDEEVIAAADAAGIAMVFTGMRAFKH